MKRGSLPDETTLVFWGVVAIFPNIDNNFRLVAVKKAFNKRSTYIQSTECIVEVFEICLSSNNSQFRVDHFVQAHGTAMGPKEYMHTDLAIREKELQDKFMDLINQTCGGAIGVM